MGGHTVVAKLLARFGTEEQKERYLPRMATGEVRATMALTEPGGGSDLQAMRTTARRRRRRLRRQRHQDVDHQLPPLAADRPAVQDRSGRAAAAPRHQHPAGRARPRAHGLAGPAASSATRAWRAASCPSTDYRAPATALLGGVEGQGFAQMMKGLETGRIQVASRALGVARAALDDALRYAQERETFGKPIWQHQSIGNYLADMATKLTAARQLVLHAAHAVRRGRAVRHGGGHGEAVRLRGGDGDRPERGPHPRRLRLLHRVRRRALLPRRAADDRRRGHQRDPAQRHRRPAGRPRAP